MLELRYPLVRIIEYSGGVVDGLPIESCVENLGVKWPVSVRFHGYVSRG